jgi:hypothetical protein
MLSIPVTGKLAKGLYSIIKIPKQKCSSPFQSKYFEAISDQHKIQLLSCLFPKSRFAAFSRVDISDSLIVADAPQG